MSKTIVEVLGYGTDRAGQITRWVRYADGSEGVQTGTISEVVGEIIRADGTVQPGAEIIDINVRSAP